MNDNFLKKHNIQSIMTICEHTLAPYLKIKFNDDTELNLHITRTELENVNVDEYIKNIIIYEYYKKIVNQRNFKIKKIMKQLNETI